LAALVWVVGASGCMAPDDVFEASDNLRITTVTRQSDGLEIYDGCVIDRLGAPIPAFDAAAGDVLIERASVIERDKRTETYSAAIEDHTDDAYWCGPEDTYGQDIPGSVGLADCYRAAGADPPVIVLSQTLEFTGAPMVPIAVTRSLQVQHSGTLTLAPHPPCPEAGMLPPTVDELTIQ
jgi:hypothetical protein